MNVHRVPLPVENASRTKLEKHNLRFTRFERLRRLKDHVEQHITDDLTRSDAARVVGVEARYFHTYFRQRIGLTFKNWLNSTRVFYAIRLMSEDLSISEISSMAGFRDLRTFERAFKRYLGYRPMEYKRRLCFSTGRESESENAGAS